SKAKENFPYFQFQFKKIIFKILASFLEPPERKSIWGRAKKAYLCLLDTDRKEKAIFLEVGKPSWTNKVVGKGVQVKRIQEIEVFENPEKKIQIFSLSPYLVIVFGEKGAEKIIESAFGSPPQTTSHLLKHALSQKHPLWISCLGEMIKLPRNSVQNALSSKKSILPKKLLTEKVKWLEVYQDLPSFVTWRFYISSKKDLQNPFGRPVVTIQDLRIPQNFKGGVIALLHPTDRVKKAFEKWPYGPLVQNYPIFACWMGKTLNSSYKLPLILRSITWCVYYGPSDTIKEVFQKIKNQGHRENFIESPKKNIELALANNHIMIRKQNSLWIGLGLNKIFSKFKHREMKRRKKNKKNPYRRNLNRKKEEILRRKREERIKKMIFKKLNQVLSLEMTAISWPKWLQENSHPSLIFAGNPEKGFPLLGFSFHTHSLQIISNIQELKIYHLLKEFLEKESL
ncbi:MAG: hypothetical protein D6785_07940, partial [Planctomycetota bacterium]